MWRGLRRTVGRQLALLALILIGFYYYSSPVLSMVLALGGQYWAGVRTSVGATELRLAEGWLRLSDVRLDNPQGFESPQFVHIGKADVLFNPASLGRPVIEITHLALTDVALHVELGVLHSNAGTVLSHLARFQTHSDPAFAPTRVIVRRLELRNVHALIGYAPVLSRRGQVGVVLEDAVLLEVGARAGGLAPAALAHGIIDRIVRQALAEAARLR